MDKTIYRYIIGQMEVLPHCRRLEVPLEVFDVHSIDMSVRL